MRSLRVSTSLFALTSLAACGGGGGTNSAGSNAPVATAPGSDSNAGNPAPTPSPTPAPAPTPTPTPSSSGGGQLITPSAQQSIRSGNDTAEFRQNYVATEFVHALYALDHGWTGQGVTVGVLDDGVKGDVAALNGQISPLSKDFGYETRDGVTTKRDRIGDDQSDHGTAVAAIIAARRDGDGTVGMAPDAKIAVLRTSDYNYGTGTETLGRDSEAIDYARGVGIKVINRSLTSAGFNVSLRNAMTSFAAGGGLLVNAAGNSGGADPGDAVNVDASNRNGWLFVVALDPNSHGDYALASYSNKAGSMADRTVTAVGTNFTTRIDGAVSSFSGTSSAAAQVSGLVATILSKWPQLTGVQAGQVVLATAKDIGAPGVDPVFGAGLIDVEAALSPVDPKLSNGSAQTSIGDAVMTVPSTISTGSIQTALSKVTVLDRFGRDFTGSLASLVVTPEAGRPQWLRNRMAQMASGGSAVSAGPFYASLGYASYRYGAEPGEVRPMVTSGEMGYRFGTSQVRMGVNTQDSLQHDIMGLAPFADGILAYAPQAGTNVAYDRETPLGRLGFSVATGGFGKARARAATVSFAHGATEIRASQIEESGSVMGVASGGAMSLGRGASTSLIELHHRAGALLGWGIEAYGSVGVTRLKIDATSIVTGAAPLLGTRAGLQASGPALGGLLSFGIAQPLMIERGRATMTFGTGYDLASRSLVLGSTHADLRSTERRLQLTAGFARGGARSSLRLGMMQDVTDGSIRALTGYSLAF